MKQKSNPPSVYVVAGPNGSGKTTFARTYLSFFRDLKKKDYLIHIFCLWIHNIDLALERIGDRVRQGRHNIPDAIVRRRFPLSCGARNFKDLAAISPSSYHLPCPQHRWNAFYERIQKMLSKNRLLLLSPFDEKSLRIAVETLNIRNELVAVIAEKVFVAYAASGSKTEQFC